jgi:hypothetical protein
MDKIDELIMNFANAVSVDLRGLPLGKKFDNIEKAEATRAALRQEFERMEKRIDELVPQCDAAYAPYREMVQEARAESDRLGEALYAAQMKISDLETAQEWTLFTDKRPTPGKMYITKICWKYSAPKEGS